MGKRDIKMSNPNYNPNYPDPSYNPNFNPSTPIPGDAPPSYNQIKGGQSIMTGYPTVNPANVVVLEERNIQGQKPVSFPPHAPVAQKIADQRRLIANSAKKVPFLYKKDV